MSNLEALNERLQTVATSPFNPLIASMANKAVSAGFRFSESGTHVEVGLSVQIEQASETPEALAWTIPVLDERTRPFTLGVQLREKKYSVRYINEETAARFCREADLPAQSLQNAILNLIGWAPARYLVDASNGQALRVRNLPKLARIVANSPFPDVGYPHEKYTNENPKSRLTFSKIQKKHFQMYYDAITGEQL